MAGTVPVTSGQGFTFPQKVFNGQVLFTADDGVHGFELWSFPAGACTEPVGIGCGDGLQEPAFDVTDPVLGDTVTMRGLDASPNRPGLLIVGAPGDGVLMPNGCTLYVDNADVLTTFSSDAQGAWGMTFPLPNDPALEGLQIALQAAIAAPIVLETSWAVLATFGR